MDEDCPRGCVEVRGGAGRDVVVAAAPYPRPIPGVPLERNLNGISFAVANVTGMCGAVGVSSCGVASTARVFADTSGPGASSQVCIRPSAGQCLASKKATQVDWMD